MKLSTAVDEFYQSTLDTLMTNHKPLIGKKMLYCAIWRQQMSAQIVPQKSAFPKGVQTQYIARWGPSSTTDWTSIPVQLPTHNHVHFCLAASTCLYLFSSRCQPRCPCHSQSSYYVCSSCVCPFRLQTHRWPWIFSSIWAMLHHQPLSKIVTPVVFIITWA